MKNIYIKRFWIILALYLLSIIAQAGDNTYKCKILQAIEMTDNGLMKEPDGFWKRKIGETFTINRNTGEMIGSPFSTESWLGGVKILNPGGNGNSYMAMVISGGPNISINYIYVAEYKEQLIKPFWGSGYDGVIFSGLCE